MPKLNWNIFEQLSGSTQENFEMLCRALISKHYKRNGSFAALSNQPGVEFHLKLDKACSLGESNRWFGWQCKWFNSTGTKNLNASQRGQIEKSLRISERELPNLTDWILWTKQPLTKVDQKWFYALKTNYKLQLWTANDVEYLLNGDAEIFRHTYFGELILTPQTLSSLHAVSVEQIKGRWIPEVHQIVNTERILRRMLGEKESWDSINILLGKLFISIKVLNTNLCTLPKLLIESVNNFIKITNQMIVTLNDVSKLLEQGDFELVRQSLAFRNIDIYNSLLILPRKLRNAKHFLSLIITNAIADLLLAEEILREVNDSLGTRIIGVLADAGCGKTQLAAQLTSETSDRPAGIILYGRDLCSSDDLNKLANKVVIPGSGIPIVSMEALIAAVNAAGQRAHRRLPLVIDGLNEAEDVRKWKGPIASLNKILNEYPNVLVVCTIRTSSRLIPESHRWRVGNKECTPRTTFADEALPSDIMKLEISEFGSYTLDAMKKYFQHYKIILGDADLPLELLSHPLTLRLYCEVTNPTREKEVGIEAMPGSLTALFEKYLEQTEKRVAFLAKVNFRYLDQDVHNVFYKLGIVLWEKKSREINQDEFRKSIGDETRLWNQSIIRALEQEGIILRVPGYSPGSFELMSIYDTLGGYFIANSILRKHGRDGFQQWLKDPNNIKRLTISSYDCHPLANDIIQSLVGLMPRILGQQLWKYLEEPLRSYALEGTTKLESKYMDAETVDEISKNILDSHSNQHNLLTRLYHTRSSDAHPLNAKFLDVLLTSTTMANRDIIWTEWVRSNKKELIEDIEKLEELWRSKTNRFPTDFLRAEWVKWMLTSTLRILRDKATRALYWYGRGVPESIFEMTIKSLAINDPYVPERMLAASYGVAMALHGDSTNQDFRDKILSDYALQLYQSMFAKSAPYSTTHALMRDFARHTIQLAIIYNPSLLKSTERNRLVSPFHGCGIRKWGRHTGFRHNVELGYGSPLSMDFANYTLGRLVPNRRNYDNNNLEYKRVVENIYWRLDQLGYSHEVFGEIDKVISSDNWQSRIQDNEGRIDRYGKKYSWIAYYELFGLRYDKGLLKERYNSEDERPSDIDIDPSFPDESNDIQIFTKDCLGDRNLSLAEWIDRGESPDIQPHLILEELSGEKGPWILLNGQLSQHEKRIGRTILFSPRGFFIKKNNVTRIIRLLKEENYEVVDFPEIPADYYTLAGEIPWCDTFRNNAWCDLELNFGHKIKNVAKDEWQLFKKNKKMNALETDKFLKMLQPLLTEKNESELHSFLKSKTITIKKVKVRDKINEPISEILKVLPPVRRNNWESYHSGINIGQNATIPSREISEVCRLTIKPPSWELYDANNQLASFSNKWGNLWRTGEELCYLRKDLFDSFLKKKNLDFIWLYWGAREIQMDFDEQEKQKAKIKHWRKDFSKIYYYNNGKIIASKSMECFARN